MTSTQPVGSSGAGVPDPISVPPRTPGRWAAMILGAPGVGVVATVVAWMVVTSEAGTGGIEEVVGLLVAALVAAILVQVAGVVLLVFALFPAGMRLVVGTMAALLSAGAVVLAVVIFLDGFWPMSVVLVLVAPWLTSIMVVSTDDRARRPADVTSHR